MTILWSDGFDSYTATGDLSKQWSSVGTSIAWNSTGGVDGGGCLELDSTTGGQRIISPLSFSIAAGASGAAGFFFKASAAPSGRTMFAAWLNNGGIIANYGVDTSGRLVHLDTSTGLKSTGSTNICDGSYHYIEVKDKLDNGSTGSAYVDSVSQWASIDLFTNNNGPANSFAFYTVGGITIYIDDVVVYDQGDTGLDADSFPYGVRKIATRGPNGDASVAFTPSTGGTNYTLIDETGGDLSDYVESGSSGATDLYDYADLGFTPSSISAVVIKAFMRSSNMGALSCYLPAKSSTTQSDGSSIVVPIAPAGAIVLREVDKDPNTSAAWTESGYNAATFGVKVA